jgi:hypothetical protein
MVAGRCGGGERSCWWLVAAAAEGHGGRPVGVESGGLLSKTQPRLGEARWQEAGGGGGGRR